MSRILDRAAQIAAVGIQAMVASTALPARARRSVEVYLLVTGCNINGATAAALAGCTKQNVSKLLRSVEARRDDPRFDQVLAGLERQLFGEVWDG